MKKLSRWEKTGAGVRTAGVTAIAAALMFGVQTAWGAPSSGSAVSDNIVVRQEAVTGAQVGSLYADQEVTITGETEGSDGKVWYQITFEGNGEEKTGWVRSDLIEAGETETPGEETEDGQTSAPAAEENDAAGVRVETGAGYVDLVDVPEEEASLVSSRFTAAVCELEDGSVQGYQLAEPDEMVAADADLTAFYYLYGTNEIGEQGWYIYDAEEGSIQKCLDNMHYAVPEETDAEQSQDFDAGSLNRMLFGGLCLICLLLLVLTIVFSVRYRRLRKLLEKETELPEERAAAADRAERKAKKRSADRVPEAEEQEEKARRKKSVQKNQPEKKAEPEKEDYAIPTAEEDGYDLPDDDSYDVYDLDELDGILEAEKESEMSEYHDPEEILKHQDIAQAGETPSGEDEDLEKILREESEKLFGTAGKAAEKTAPGKKDSGRQKEKGAASGMRPDGEEKKSPENSIPDLPEDIEFVDDGIEDEDLEFL